MARGDTDGPTQLLPVVGPRGRHLPVAGLLAREGNPKVPDDPEAAPSEARPRRRARRIAGLCIVGLAVVGGVALVVDEVARAPEHASHVEPQRKAPARPTARQATAHDVMQAPKPPADRVEPKPAQPANVPKRKPPEQPPAESPEQAYQEMAAELAKRYGQGRWGG